MRVVITGATGNVGTSVVERLSEDDAVTEIVGIARRPTNWSPPKTRWVQADVAVDDLTSVFRDADAVVHLAWRFQPTHRPLVTWRTNVLGSIPSGPPPVYPPEKVAEAILRSAQRPKRDIIVGGAAKAQLLAQKVSPRLVDAFASVAGVFLQKSNRPKQPSDGDALFEPPSGDDRERGEVSTGEPRGGT